MGGFFVEPESTRIELEKCESWIEIKKELNKAEYDTVIGAGIASFQDVDGETSYNLAASSVNIVKLRTWILDWGFTDTGDKHVPVSSQAIENLSVDVADEIIAAIEKHQEQQEQEKKVPTPVTRPKAI